MDGHIKFATEEAAKKAVNLREYLLGPRIKLFPRLENPGASKTLLMKDIPFYTVRSDVGKIVDVCFFCDKDEKFDWSRHIEFATEEAAEKLWLLIASLVPFLQLISSGLLGSISLKMLGISLLCACFSRDKYQTTLRRVSHVEFASEEAVKEAVKWNDRDSLGCPVRLGIVRDRLTASVSKVLILLSESIRSGALRIHHSRGSSRVPRHWCSHWLVDFLPGRPLQFLLESTYSMTWTLHFCSNW
ncbi:hypothetical protein C5167_022532 [Papaver somniferum]|uniref:Uncharacterized protein n=1 Tax=Papaver somniferum TaxID=3469 RepID=A0A4Y7JM09_PAPSO|nr:hypothetical protein C5167_022532 [Papaver somniferum]